MAGTSKAVATFLLLINILLYLIVLVIASWAANHTIARTHETASMLSIPARLFPLYFIMGNMATGFLVICSLLASVVGITTSVTGLMNVSQWDAPNINAAASSAMISLSLTLLSMGFACKEIAIGWTDSNLRTLEVATIIVSATQLLYTGLVHAGVQEEVARRRLRGGRV